MEDAAGDSRKKKAEGAKIIKRKSHLYIGKLPKLVIPGWGLMSESNWVCVVKYMVLFS